MDVQRKRRLKKIALAKELLEGALLDFQTRVETMEPFWKSLYYLVALAKEAKRS